MRYDIEFPAAQLFADYLNAQASTIAGMITDKNRCPIVTFFDPMSVADADRVIVMCPDATTDAADSGRFSATMDIGIKTLWTQATVAAAFKTHFARVNDIRDKLMPAPRSLVDLLTPYLPAGMSVDFVGPRKNFKSHIAQSAEAKWIFSGTVFDITGFFVS